MHLLENISLKPYNTFGMDVTARWFTEIKSDHDLTAFYSAIRLDQLPVLLVGGGSNLLFTRDYPGTVALIRSKGMVKLMEDDHHLFLKVAAGEVWDDVVKHAVDNGWGGIENLSLIPGTMGAAPVQNIGAYGVEIRDVIYSVEVADIAARNFRSFRPDDCQFGYRTSIFKTIGRDRLVITSVCLKLEKQPRLRLDYGDIQRELEQHGISSPTLADVRNLICDIRRRKLPDPLITGNAGSFFKNPVVTSSKLAELQQRFPSIKSFPHEGEYKLAAAWLIEQCGWKGVRRGDAGVHPGQPLVLVNHGTASGQEIVALAEEIAASVAERFDVTLEREVNVI